MHFGEGFVVGFVNDGQNGGKRKCYDDFVDRGRHDVGGIDHRSMPDDGAIKLVTTENASQTADRPLR